MANRVTELLDMFKKRDPICVSHYPVPISQHTPEQAEELMELSIIPTGVKGAALYIHIPFCDKVCSFCPFNKYIYDEAKVETYITALKKELHHLADTPYGRHVVLESINFGGGTPTSLTAAQLIDILGEIRQAFSISANVMIFVEGNPKNFTREKLELLSTVGLNRISVGVQTFQEHLAEKLELYHSIADSLEVVKNASQAGIDNIGIDLMYNLPGQDEKDWEADIKQTIRLGIHHVCLISFCVVPHTRVARQIADGQLPGTGNIEKEINLYRMAVHLLKNAGYVQYSVIDFAKPGKIDHHAQMYFAEQADLIGLGTAAFGYINGYMYVNLGNMDEYRRAIDNHQVPVVWGEKADKMERAHGMMAKGLRMISIDREKFRTRFGADPETFFPGPIQSLVNAGLLTTDDRGIHLTEDGIIWGNNVCKEFFSDKYKNYGLDARMKFAGGKR